MEEKFGKSARVLYIVTYSITIPLSLLIFVGFGALLTAYQSDLLVLGVFLIALGVILAGVSIGWLVYFIKMPPYTVTYKDGILNFRNKVQCTPAELDSYEKRNLNLDGEIFGFGKLFVNINGKRYKFGYVYDVESVLQRLYTIKVEYAVQQNIANRKEETVAEVTNETETEEKNG